MRNALISFALLFGSASVSQAAFVHWTDWMTSDLETSTGTMGSVGVTFESDGLLFAQLGAGNLVGTGSPGGNPDPDVNYWTEGTPAPYTGNAVVDNAPTPHELLGFSNPSETNVLTFDMPVLNPVMALVSMGAANNFVAYNFDTPFTLLSEGEGYWGDGTYDIFGNTLEGEELHGVIQFQGLITQIQWSSSFEYWHGFTVGYSVPSPSVPEPATAGLLLTSLLALALRRRPRAL